MPIHFILIIIFLLGIGLLLLFKKTTSIRVKSEVIHPEWSKNAVIYEANIRQFTIEGTFQAFEKHLPRLKQMGIGIIWIMPIHPIGIKNRLGKLGSYYSVMNYKTVNPEFGTMDDFKHLVKSIHKLNMKVILDWVPNHTSWDNVLTKKHPEYYYKDESDNFVPPYDWKDVIRLNYYNPATRDYMSNVMQWWVKETDIDGFRCDMANLILKEFWEELRPKLEKIKPVFMLAESDSRGHHEKGFDMTFDWKFHHLMNEIGKGKKKIKSIAKHFKQVDSTYPENSYLMQFTSNHDENSWNGTEFERLGEGTKAFAVLTATVPGMLLIYNGQESAFNRRLKFFEKDFIDWDNFPLWKFYYHLITLKKRNRALWNGNNGGKMILISTSYKSSVFAFVRKKNKYKVLVVLNLSNKELEVKLKSKLLPGKYIEIFTNTEYCFKKKEKLHLKAWNYMVFEKVNKLSEQF